MDPVPARSRARSLLRRRASLLTLAAAAGLVAGALTLTPAGEQVADAVPPCTVPQFAPGAAPSACPTPSSSTVPPTTSSPPSTTVPPTTVPPPGAITWSTRVEVLDRTGLERFPAGDGLDEDLLGHWYNADNTVATARTPVVWDATQVGPPPNNRGTVGATSPSIGPGTVQFRLSEERFGFSGLLCRSQPMAAIPTGPHTARVLVPAPTTFTSEQLDALIASLPGTTIRPDTSTSVTITAASLDPTPSGLDIALAGRVHVRDFIDYDGAFSYTLTLGLHAASDAHDLRSVISVQAPQPGELDLDPNGLSDAVLQQLAGNEEPLFRQAVVTNAHATFNDAVGNDPGVQFFRAMGYTASARAVTLTDDSITVSPALCTFD